MVTEIIKDQPWCRKRRDGRKNEWETIITHTFSSYIALEKNI
jgi:hypothetical protein